MKKALLPCLFALLVFTSCKSQSAQPVSAKGASLSSGSFAVVELFTSQGCSSCPPADAILGKEIAAAKQSGKKLIALSFHVDYWNRLGWTDPFSQHVFSQRQYGYSAKMKGDGLYTPQAIVNGQQEAVGGNQGKVEGYINTALAQKPIASISISAIIAKGNNLEITCQYNGPAVDLNVAVVQKQTSTPIKAGENEGSSLTNYNVVRSWKTLPAQTGTQKLEIETPTGYKSDDFEVIVYAQEKSYGKIVAADMR